MSIATRDARRARLANNRLHIGLTRPAFIDVIRGEAAAFMQTHALSKLKELVGPQKMRVLDNGSLHTPTIAEAMPEQKRVAMAYGIVCGRAYARRMGRYYGLFDKYAPGGSIAATN